MPTNDVRLPTSDDRKVSFYQQDIELLTVLAKVGVGVWVGGDNPTPPTSKCPYLRPLYLVNILLVGKKIHSVNISMVVAK